MMGLNFLTRLRCLFSNTDPQIKIIGSEGNGALSEKYGALELTLVGKFLTVDMHNELNKLPVPTKIISRRRKCESKIWAIWYQCLTTLRYFSYLETERKSEFFFRVCLCHWQRIILLRFFFYGSDIGQKVILFNSKHILIEDRLIFLKSWFKAVIVLSWILSCSAKNSNKAITRRFCSFDVSSRAIESWYRIFLPSSFTWSWPTQGVHEAFMFAALQKAKSEFQELVQWASVFILFLKK